MDTKQKNFKIKKVKKKTICSRERQKRKSEFRRSRAIYFFHSSTSSSLAGKPDEKEKETVRNSLFQFFFLIKNIS